jgi:hypothetical protein
MTFPVTFTVFSTKKKFTFQAETVEKTEKRMRYKIHGGKSVIVLQKDLTVNNKPWELVEGSISGLTLPDQTDIIRQIGADIERRLKGYYG